MSWLNWFRRRRPSEPDWQGLVDALVLAAAIGMGEAPRRWAPIRHRFMARTIADHYYAVLLAGNVSIDAIDAELFALDAALEGIDR